jgi:hypothetical protein
MNVELLSNTFLERKLFMNALRDEAELANIR